MAINVPADFICPITSAVMENPVMDREGNSYEESAINKWLSSGNQTSPITRNPLTRADLVTNRALKNSIEQFLKANQGKDLSVKAPRQTADTNSQPNHTAGGNSHAANTTTGASAQVPPEVKLIHDEDGRYLLSIVPPPSPTGTTRDPKKDRLPVDIVCVIDISGSMNTAATVQNEKNEVESHGLTMFNVVEHATKTVSKLLGEQDRFALVTFNQTAQQELGLTVMDSTGQKLVEDKLVAMHPSGRTNLWGGLQLAMDMIRDAPAPSSSATQRTTSIMLLTDGRPNVEPPRGHMPTLKNYLSKLDPASTAPFTINTFGFGYDLDSGLLNEIASETGGMYTFIPDSGLVGTVFVNTLANLIVSMSTSVKVSIEAPAPIKHSMQLAPTLLGGEGNIGSLQYGQSRDIYFRLATEAQKSGSADADACKSVFAKVDMMLNNQIVSLTVESRPADPREIPTIKDHAARSQFCSVITTSSPEQANSKNLTQLVNALNNLASPSNSPMVAALLKDVQGEVTMAYSKDSLFTKWGRHYLPSLVRANVLQQCNNFKDHSVQMYGGGLFTAVRDAGESTFLALPPPEPKASPNTSFGLSSRSSSSSSVGGGLLFGSTSAPAPATRLRGVSFSSGPSSSYAGPRTRAPAQPVSNRPAQPANMSSYYNCSGGCITGDSLVSLWGGVQKQAADVSRGDILASGARVDCRVAISTTPDLTLVKFEESGLSISPYHPIRLSGSDQWVFPTNCDDGSRPGISTVAAPEAPVIYSYLLDATEKQQWVSVGGIDVVAMAHGLTDAEGVVTHEYFGTDSIRNDLQSLDGYEEGVVHVKGWTRHQNMHRVNGLI